MWLVSKGGRAEGEVALVSELSLTGRDCAQFGGLPGVTRLVSPGYALALAHCVHTSALVTLACPGLSPALQTCAHNSLKHSEATTWHQTFSSCPFQVCQRAQA